jgi:hypothetical protein
MKNPTIHSSECVSKLLWIIAILAAVLIASLPQAAMALPLFARQTGQNCVACHAGGQFPELTSYGRLFKLTGYTMGERTVPVSIMGVLTNSRVADTSKSDDPGADFQKNGQTIFATGSLFLGGKITDNIGALAQITYNPYASQDANGQFHGHTNADNMDLRYADRFIDEKRDLIFGISANNNPSISDPWNTAAAWMQYVPVPSPTSSRFIDGTTPYPSYATGGNIAGVTAYAYWNQSVYAELGGYTTSRGIASFMSAGLGNDRTTKLRGVNPYLRLAWNREWGAHSLMIGTAGMVAQIYDNPLDTSDPATTHHTRDWKIDAQYQYLLDPHSVTGQLVFAHNRHRYPDSVANQAVAFTDAAGNPLGNTNAVDTTNLMRAKLTYVYQAKYGGSLAFFNRTGSTNTANQTSGFDPGTLSITSDPGAQAPSLRVGGNLSGNPATRGLTFETFWMPKQYVRIGAQYTAYSRYNGTSNNYDGFGRNARDNNSLFIYLWAAY